MYIDAHSHLCDLRLAQPAQSRRDTLSLPRSIAEEWLNEAIDQFGIQFFLQGGIDPEDWQRQRQLSHQFPGHIGLCFGLHPYFIAKSSLDECELALDQLSLEIGEAMALGELGLDFRPQFVARDEDRDRQIEFFQNQIELAQLSQKPMVLHIVQAHEEALRVLDWTLPQTRTSIQAKADLVDISSEDKPIGMIHSFNGSWPQAQEYLSRGFYLSIGGPVARQSNKRLHQAVAHIPIEKILIETDAPDQPGDQFHGQLNPLKSLFSVAEAIGKIKGIETLEIMKISGDNFQRLFSK